MKPIRSRNLRKRGASPVAPKPTKAEDLSPRAFGSGFQGADASKVTGPLPASGRVSFQGAGITVGSPELGTPALGQRHRFIAATAQQQPSTPLPLATAQPTPRAKSRRTAASRSVRTNRIAIFLSVASLTVLIDEKLASLRDERPNDGDTQAARDEAIAHYESLKQDLEALRDVTLRLERGKAEEKTAENAANTFVRRIRNWWEKGHEKICAKAYDAAIFVSCLSVCSLLGCGGTTAVVVSGAIAGGETVVNALKALPKRLG